jgi:putative SOS response-associated peptidase YedK
MPYRLSSTGVLTCKITFVESGIQPYVADFFKMFNARGETLAEKGVFSRLLKRGRGVVLLNGFYEWAAEGGRGRDAVKQPYYLHIATTPTIKKREEEKDATAAEAAAAAKPREQEESEPLEEEQVLRCAALYDVWYPSDGPPMASCTIITVPAADSIAWLHDRMPAVLRTDEDVNAWLHGGSQRGDGDGSGGKEGEVGLYKLNPVDTFPQSAWFQPWKL